MSAAIPGGFNVARNAVKSSLNRAGSGMIENGQSHRLPMEQHLYDPPSRPQRPFGEDYPGISSGSTEGGPLVRSHGDIGAPLTHDIDGRALRAKYITGRREVGGPDVGLSNKELIDLRKEIGIPLNIEDIGAGAIGHYRWRSAQDPATQGRGLITLNSRLSDDGKRIVHRHELGHGIEDHSGYTRNLDNIQIPEKAREPLFDNFHRMATGTEPTGGIKDVTRDLI